MVIIKIPLEKIEGGRNAALSSSRRLRGLPPIPISPLSNPRRRSRSSSVSTLRQGVLLPPASPPCSPGTQQRSRKGSVIIYSNPNSGPSTPRSGDWDHYTEQPSFWNSRFGWITQQNGIQLVNTESESLSSLEVDQSLAEEINNIVSEI